MAETTTWKFVYFPILMMALNISALSQSHATPLVHEEHFHRPIYENGQIRVLNVRASNGDTTAFHRHCNPILYITIHGTEVSLQEESSSWKKVELPSGWIGEDIYHSDSCFIHRFAISGKNELQIVAIEALSNSFQVSSDFDLVYSRNGFSLYKIESFSSGAMERLVSPVILVESTCPNKCDVQVISHEELSSEILERYDGYLLGFKH